MKRFIASAGALIVAACLAPLVLAGEAGAYDFFARTNLMAWCIVPFDARKRSPEARAEMLERLGFKMFAYDYRAEHIPQWEEELAALERHHVRLSAWWFPTSLNDEGRKILALLKQHHLRPQLWVMGGGAPTKSAAEQSARVSSEAKRIREIADAAGAIGCTVALYNHGAWFGEPENQVAIVENLRSSGVTNVGIVYNLHHGHEHTSRFASELQRMKPYLWVLNLNGMQAGSERADWKIVPLGQGEMDLSLLKLIRDSGWRGPLGILNHTDADAEGRLADNLAGFDWLVQQLDGKAPGPKPIPRTWTRPTSH